MTTPSHLLAAALLAGPAAVATAADGVLPPKYHQHRKAFDRAVAEQRDKAAKAYEASLTVIGNLRPEVMAESERKRLLAESTLAVAAFRKDGRLSAGLAPHDASGVYLATVRKAAVVLAGQARGLTNGLGPTHPQRAALDAAADAAYDEVNRLDLLQVGTVWDGVRRDKPLPPTVTKQINPFRAGHSRYHISRPGGGQVDWDLEITSRRGDRVEGRVSQGGGAKTKWNMVGTFDGHQLTMSNKDLPGFGMLGGAAPRVFVYSGRVIGDSGILDHTGYRADGKRVVGYVWLGLRK